MTRHTADAVACTGLAYAFADTNAVDGVDLTVREGEVFGLLGPNGAALRGLLIGSPAHLALDFAVLLVAAALGITAASSLLGRLAR